MEKLRIHKMKYRNRGIANKELKGVNEIHVIFKFNTDKEATDFITKVKEWHYGLEEVGEQIKTALKQTDGQINELANYIMNEVEGEPSKSEGAVDCAIRLLKKHYSKQDETPEILKKPASTKRKAGRPSKKVVQG